MTADGPLWALAESTEPAHRGGRVARRASPWFTVRYLGAPQPVDAGYISRAHPEDEWRATLSSPPFSRVPSLDLGSFAARGDAIEAVRTAYLAEHPPARQDQ